MKKNVFDFFTVAGLLILILVFQGNAVYSQKAENQVPEPRVIQPGKKGKAPSDAIILFEQNQPF